MNLTTWEWFLLQVGTKCSSLVTCLWNYGENLQGKMSQTIYPHRHFSPSTINFPSVFNKTMEDHGKMLAPAIRICKKWKNLGTLVFITHFCGEEPWDKSSLIIGPVISSEFAVVGHKLSFFWGGGLSRIELRDLFLLAKCSTTWAKSPTAINSLF